MIPLRLSPWSALLFLSAAAFLFFSVTISAQTPESGTAPTAPPAAEKAIYDVILAETGPSKIAVIKEVRDAISGIGLADAKALVESAPQPIKRGLTKPEAEQLKQKFESVGAKVTVKSGGSTVELGSNALPLDEDGRYDVILSEIGASKIAVIKEVRGAISGIGLADAKAFVEAAPQPIKRGVTQAEAERLKQSFEAAGAQVMIKEQ